MLPGSITFRGGITIYIEEPEAHIFPTAQKEIVQLIALAYNASLLERPSQFVITTHSPYILTEFNNLLYAGILEQKIKKKARVDLYNLIPKEQILHPKSIRSYSLENGVYKSLYSEQTGLLTSDVIDNVSDEFSKEFSKLLELDS